MGTSEQADDAGEGGTSMLPSETVPRFLLCPLITAREDLAAATFLRNHQMPTQRRQAKISSKTGIHHHIRACCLLPISVCRIDVSGTTSAASLLLLSKAAVLAAEPFAIPCNPEAEASVTLTAEDL